MAFVDKTTALIPRRVPDRQALERCRIISHRGEHDNTNVMENTLQAYDIATAAGVWGIEADIRWTADLVPVICHDTSPARVFGIATAVSDLSFAQLRAQVPLIPTLQEVIDAFGGNTHLMLELKAEPRPQQAGQREILQTLLAPLAPARDYHILALDPALFEQVDFLPKNCLFPVAQTNVALLSRLSIERAYGGLGGHYLLLTDRLRQCHEAAGQRLGTGFPGSKNCLFRELNRGIEWIFSNNAVEMQSVRDQHLAMLSRSVQ